MNIATEADWWDVTIKHWDKIIGILERADAPLSEHWWRDGIGQHDTYHEQVFLAVLTKLRDDRDGPALARMFNLCWIAAPDSPNIHSWPFWSGFCDLCSETWVFDREQTEPTHPHRLNEGDERP